jgi:hypothetical protein
MKSDALAIVPLDVEKLEGIALDHNRKLTADDKKRLLEVLRKKMDENRNLLHAKRQEIMEQILRSEREKCGLEVFRKELEAVDEEISTLVLRKETISTRCQNTTGFDVEGNLVNLDSNPHRYNSGENTRQLWAVKRASAIKKSSIIREKINIALQLVDRFGLKFDKVETRLILSSSYGEAMSIMEALLGNGDTILEAQPVTTDRKE